jgi:hypothetical protein
MGIFITHMSLNSEARAVHHRLIKLPVVSRLGHTNDTISHIVPTATPEIVDEVPDGGQS